MFRAFLGQERPSNDWAAVPEGSRVYAVGDIHGRLDLLRALHEVILADAEASDAARKIVVYLGDYVDRGSEPEGVVELLIEEPLPGFETVHLIGNHEAFMLEFLEDDSIISAWLMNGGETTLLSYSVDIYAASGPDRAAWLQSQLKSRLTEAHLAFLRGLKTHHVEGDYLFVHAGLRPGVPIESQDTFDLIWIREPFLSSGEDFGKIVVHGHTPTGHPECRSNRIGIDTGAVYGGNLTALALEGREQRFLQV